MEEMMKKHQEKMEAEWGKDDKYFKETTPPSERYNFGNCPHYEKDHFDYRLEEFDIYKLSGSWMEIYNERGINDK